MSPLVEATVACPHCWNRFHGDRAWYISSHTKLIGDPVLGAVQKRYAPADVRHKGNKVVDEEGWEMVQRACPRCHLQIPDHMLASRARFVSIAGAIMSTTLARWNRRSSSTTHLAIRTATKNAWQLSTKKSYFLRQTQLSQ